MLSVERFRVVLGKGWRPDLDSIETGPESIGIAGDDSFGFLKTANGRPAETANSLDSASEYRLRSIEQKELVYARRRGRGGRKVGCRG